MKQSVVRLVLLLALAGFCLGLPTSAIASEAASTEIAVSAGAGAPGDEVTLNVTLSGNPGMAFLKLKVDYDSSLSLVSARNKGVLGGTFTVSQTTAVKPYVLQWMGASDSAGNGVIATVTFKIASGAAAGSKPVTVTVDECYNASLADVTVAVKNAAVSVTGTTRTTAKTPAKGDADGDGDVTMKDVLLARKFIAKMGVKVNESALDVDGDRDVTMKDVLLIRKFIAGFMKQLG